MEKIYIVKEGEFEVFKLKKDKQTEKVELSENQVLKMLGSKDKFVDEGFLRLIKKTKIGQEAKSKVNHISLAQLCQG